MVTLMQPFNIIFYKGNSPIARLIQFLTKSNYSHVALVIDNLHVIQLDWRTPVSIRHLDYLLVDYDVYELTIELSERDKRLILNYVKHRIDTSYDWKFIFSRLYNILIGTPIYNNPHKYNCDELIVEAFRHVGINLIDGDLGKQLNPELLSQSKLLRKV